ncbi:response regulator transcription factor [Rhodopirellula europaea]|uniref:Signal transduction response regulator, receiver region domain protein n=1 Tax=Rhodopirellula europaea SH398 TaxID=1263868 RepID=M5RWN5_9BACT|nr:response regulator [Rhodopirellula europaea]EMI23616.1 Signal transduction response regulator, receiver region domain protein [Rhodopirellula europaea SH398]
MPTNTARLLLVEDQANDVEITRKWLEKSSSRFELVVASSLSEAISHLKTDLTFDTVLLDLGLPDGAGLNNIRMIREADSNVPIVVLTGWDDAFVNKMLSAGAQNFLSKNGADTRLLEDAISAVLSPMASDDVNPEAIDPPRLQVDESLTIACLLELSTQLRLRCSDLALNRPEIATSPELLEASELAKRIHQLAQRFGSPK